jgi:D-cysteine desulfhydrase
MNLARFPRRRYTVGQTPIEYLEHLTRHLDGPQIYMKRDDLLGGAAGGNKTRKLEFVVAEALRQGADTLITCGAVQSNHCRLTLSAAVKEGLKCRLILEERVPGSYKPEASGNNFLYQLMGVEKIRVVPGGSDMMKEMNDEAQAVAGKGRKAYVIPGGASDAIGALGYVACAEEMLAQLFDMGLESGPGRVRQRQRRHPHRPALRLVRQQQRYRRCRRERKPHQRGPGSIDPRSGC